MSTLNLPTSHGLIHITDAGALSAPSPALLLIHGNSSCSRIFTPIISNPNIANHYRIITFDLPGHGSSSDAPDPPKTYTMHGYADLAVEVLAHLSISKVVVLGWSLGGHIGISMIPLLPTGVIKGVMIVGTPPALGKEQTSAGFKDKDAHMGLAAQETFSAQNIVDFSRGAGPPFEDWMEHAVARTDGRARRIMWEAFAGGEGVDQRKVVEEEEGVCIAVVNGGAEPFVELDYLDDIKWKRLWGGKCVRLEGLGHAPFWEKPEVFAPVLESFLKDCESM
ncbi:alpha/beta-hydrolase [Lepidopterella palustris CBS 459.81]|uniref:Alpha/beta-hydrolase n=1 Tax=Lepidopterella palustris CBS 459.81 TaxID=1314670 RepID=A0A8E2EDF7_9PEZI|nr:alpha/beta-hydrolase [Lepidopterella palustris CBS 459.81]